MRIFLRGSRLVVLVKATGDSVENVMAEYVLANQPGEESRERQKVKRKPSSNG